MTIPPVTVNGTPISQLSGSDSETSANGALGLYAGYQFNHNWNAELGYRYTVFKKNDDGISPNWNLPMVVLTAGFTF